MLENNQNWLLMMDINGDERPYICCLVIYIFSDSPNTPHYISNARAFPKKIVDANEQRYSLSMTYYVKKSQTTPRV